MGLVEVIMKKIKQERLPHWQKDLQEWIIHLSITSAMPSVILSAIPPKNVSNYLIPDIKKAFDQLSQAFTKAPILQHFDPERYIQVEIDASRHAIGGVLS